MIKEYPTLYHATRLEFLSSILRNGLQTSHCGRIHGSMNIRPPENTVYLSKHASSNNLNTNLFKGDSRVIVLEISTQNLDQTKIYPDDALFVAFGQEEVFEDADEVCEATGWSMERSEAFLSELEETHDTELARKMQFLWKWYLDVHGEISVAQDIPASNIVAVRDYETGRILEPRHLSSKSSVFDISY